MKAQQKLNETGLDDYFTWVKAVWVSSRGEPLDFKEHKYLIDIYTDQFPNIAYMKYAQGGLSERLISEATWVCDRLGKNVLYCVDEKTKLLSKRGWLTYDCLRMDDNILTLNPKSGLSEWSKPEEIFVKKVQTEMVELSNNKFSALVTKNHRWLVFNLMSRKENRRSSYYFVTTEQLHESGNRYIPRSVPHADFPKKKTYSNAFVELCGWVWTEGHYCKKQGRGIKNTMPTLIGITQSYRVNNDNVRKIELCLLETNASYKKYQSRVNSCFQFMVKGIVASEIRRLFPNKIPTMEFFLHLTKKQLDIFIQTSINADGWRRKDSNGTIVEEWAQKNYARVEAFSVACSLAGITTREVKRKTDDGYQMRLYKSNKSQTNEFKKEYINYNGIVWCPRTKNGTFLAKREGSIYWTGNTFPTSTQLADFVQARLDPVFAQSDYLSRITGVLSAEEGRFKNVEQGKKVKKVGLKKIRHAFLYLRGSQNERQIISVDADMVILDERDRFSQDNVPYIDKRLLHSTLKWRREASTPTIPGSGIHETYLESDQRIWMLKCSFCGLEQELDFFDNVDTDREITVCTKCRKPIDRLKMGRWVPQMPANTLIHGYKVNGIYNPRRSVSELIASYEKSKVSGISAMQQFYNQVLGLPYQAEGQKILISELDECLGDFDTPFACQGTFGGADVGSKIHVIISKKIEGKLRYVWIGTVTNFLGPMDSLEQLIIRFDVQAMVVDVKPDTRKLQELISKFPNRVYAAYYPTRKFDVQNYFTFDDFKLEVYIDRTISLDYLVSDIHNHLIELPRGAKHIDEFYDQMSASVRKMTLNKRNNQVEARWIEEKPDHFFHAANYNRIAVQRGSLGQALLDSYKENVNDRKKNVYPTSLAGWAKWINLGGEKVF